MSDSDAETGFKYAGVFSDSSNKISVQCLSRSNGEFQELLVEEENTEEPKNTEEPENEENIQESIVVVNKEEYSVYYNNGKFTVKLKEKSIKKIILEIKKNNQNLDTNYENIISDYYKDYNDNMGEIDGDVDISLISNHFNSINRYKYMYCDASKTMRKLRQLDSFIQLSISTLLYAHESMFRFQTFEIDGKKHVFTLAILGYELKDEIMTCIVKYVLSQNEELKKETIYFNDEIFVPDSISIPSQTIMLEHKIKDHFEKYGLTARIKDFKDLLGLEVYVDGHTECWKRPIDEYIDLTLEKCINIAEIRFRLNQLTKSFPVAGQLRINCYYMLKIISKDSNVDECKEMLTWILDSIKNPDKDPCRGKWNLGECKNCILWSDSSKNYGGYVLEIDNEIIEDGSFELSTISNLFRRKLTTIKTAETESSTNNNTTDKESSTDNNATETESSTNNNTTETESSTNNNTTETESSKNNKKQKSLPININDAELYALLQGIRVCREYKLTNLSVKCDNIAVIKLIEQYIIGKKTVPISNPELKHIFLMHLEDICSEFQSFNIDYVKSGKNKADKMTRYWSKLEK